MGFPGSYAHRVAGGSDGQRGSRGRTVLVLLVGVGVLGAAVVATRALLGAVSTASPPARADLCAQYDLFMTTFADPGTFSTQEGVRAARKLSQMAEDYRGPGRPGDRSTAGGTPVARAADDIRTVLSSVAWETPDLVSATRPVALECGWTWPVGADPPAARPDPPSR